MKKETNMRKIRETAKLFLRLPIPETEFYPVVVSHPFFSSCVVPTKDMQYLDLQKKEDLQKAYQMYDKRIDGSKDFMSLCAFINKPYRLTFMKYCEDYLSQKDFSEALAENWVLSENPNQDANVSRKKFISWFRRADKLCMMTEEDKAVYDAIPESITLYRGVTQGHERFGLSWTASYEKAEWFANRYGDGYILEVQAEKEDILCYFNTRDEDEYVLDVFQYRDKIRECQIEKEEQQEEYEPDL